LIYWETCWLFNYRNTWQRYMYELQWPL